MARLPDRFDLWVRKARECPDPARQTDFVLGALAALTEWNFLNVGTQDKPQPAEAEVEGRKHLLVFSDRDRIDEIVGERENGEALPIIAMPSAVAMTWCIERKAEGCAGLLINPGDFAALVPISQLEVFHAEWSQRGGRLASGFWIPNLTSEEEDFWQENGL
jgi:hypothetical protein